MEDKQIIDLYFARDEVAIKETKNKYGRLIFSIAKNILANNEDSEECTNDTYLGAWNTIPPTRPNSFIAYLCKIARNLSLKKLEYNKASKRNLDIQVSFDELENVLADNQISNNTSNEEIANSINRFLMSQSEEYRNVFIRKYYFFDSIKDISKMYNISEGKIKSILHRTRNRLKFHLEKEGIRI